MDASELAFEAFGSGRLEILRALEKAPQRYTDLAGKLPRSEGELSRNLKRLVEAGLLEKQASGAFAPTPLARAVLSVVPRLDLVARHAEFFQHHEVGGLAPHLLARLDALGSAALLRDPFAMFQAIQEVFGGARTHFLAQWIIQKQALTEEDHALNRILEAALDGKSVDVRGVLLQEELEVVRAGAPGLAGRFQLRVLGPAPTSLAMSDAGAFLQFQDRSGRIDFNYAFYGRDATYVAWCRDLFEDAWSRARPAYGGGEHAAPRGKGGARAP